MAVMRELTFFVRSVFIGREADVGDQVPDAGIHPVDDVGLARGAGLLHCRVVLVHLLLGLDCDGSGLVHLLRRAGSGGNDRRSRRAGQVEN